MASIRWRELNPTLAELIRFGTVGVVQNGVNVGSFAVLLALDAPYQVCASIAAVAALIVSFILNRGFTFTASSSAALHAQLWRYVIVFAGATVMAVGMLTLAVELGGLGKIPGQLVAIVIVAPFHFLAQKRWTFRTRESSPVTP